MSGANFRDLLNWELRHLVRMRVLWLILFALAAALIWGASTTAALHADQEHARQQTVQKQQEWMSMVRQRAHDYAAPSPNPLPYWQDPTDIGGFSQYFLRAYSFKPQLPLSALATGASDLVPPRLPVQVATPFGVAPSYDFLNPRTLALGPFGLSFVIVYLAPIALILLFVLLVTFERDHGVTRLIAAQSTPPGRWLFARVVALSIIVVPTILMSICAALALAGASLSQEPLDLLGALVLTAAYLMFWIAIMTYVLSGWPRASEAMGALAIVWVLLTLGVPLMADLAIDTFRPAPKAAERVDAQRQITDALDADRQDVLKAAFRARPDLIPAVDRVDDIDYATRLSFIVPELEKRLGPMQRELRAERDFQAKASWWSGFVTPSLGLEAALAHLAGTDLTRHRAFESQTREYQLELRGFFYPLMQAEIVSPSPRLVPDSYGRLNFTQYEKIPAFRIRDSTARERIVNVLPILGAMCFFAGLITVFTLRRLKQWTLAL